MDTIEADAQYEPNIENSCPTKAHQSGPDASRQGQNTERSSESTATPSRRERIRSLRVPTLSSNSSSGWSVILSHQETVAPVMIRAA